MTQQNQTITSNSGTVQVNFTCVMSGYILPDESLEWIGNTGLILENSEKHTITYRNGTQATAQNGGERRSLERISTLTVHQPTIHDSGEYNCALIGAYQFISLSMNLQVRDTNIKPARNVSSKLDFGPSLIICYIVIYMTLFACAANGWTTMDAVCIPWLWDCMRITSY